MLPKGITPFYVNGFRHPRITALIECDTSLRVGGLDRANTVLDLARYLSKLT